MADLEIYHQRALLQWRSVAIFSTYKCIVTAPFIRPAHLRPARPPPPAPPPPPCDRRPAHIGFLRGLKVQIDKGQCSASPPRRRLGIQSSPHVKQNGGRQLHDDPRLRHRLVDGLVGQDVGAVQVQLVAHDHVLAEHRHILHPHLRPRHGRRSEVAP